MELVLTNGCVGGESDHGGAAACDGLHGTAAPSARWRWRDAESGDAVATVPRAPAVVCDEAAVGVGARGAVQSEGCAGRDGCGLVAEHDGGGGKVDGIDTVAHVPFQKLGRGEVARAVSAAARRVRPRRPRRGRCLEGELEAGSGGRG